ncbi:hypothetical protein V8C37DRAFT_396383 [Trichoderma ceciliae]
MSMEVLREAIPSSEERTARVFWSAHILFYLTKRRSHVELHQTDAVEEDEEEAEADDMDAETARTVTLHGSRESVNSKFLNCIAQLFSPSKGWEDVAATALREREDSVEVDVARNDCFGISRGKNPFELAGNFEGVEAEYCRQLEKYLSTGGQQTPSRKFELAAIAYTGKRVDYWVQQLQALLHTPAHGLEPIEANWSAATKIWMKLTQFLPRRKNVEGPEFRAQIVQLAYECVLCAEVGELLCAAFDAKVGSKIRYALKFVARPLTDCRMLWHIAGRYPRFREIRISLVSPRPQTSIGLEYRVDILQAWARLTTASLPAFERKVIGEFGKQFRQDCAEAYSLHAEIQLFMRSEDNPTLSPTFPYYGCSKKACLLCESFLGALSDPITTRGRHGICYPAWGIPSSGSDRADMALKELEKVIISRIKTLLSSFVADRREYFMPPVQQSTLVSDFSDSTIQHAVQREQMVKSAKEAEEAQRRKRLIIEGVGLTPRSIAAPNSNFYPDDSCIMCNKSPANRCMQCHSSYYCSKECQVSDWSSHRLLCKSFSTQAPRPSPDYRRAILFPVNHNKPRMIWLPCERKIDEDFGHSVAYESLNPYPHLGTDRPISGSTRIEHNPIRDRNLGRGFAAYAIRKEGYAVNLLHRGAFLIDGSALNKSILTSVGESGIIPHEWRGSIIAVRERPFECYEDIALADFRHIIDYMRSYDTTEVRESTGRPEDRPSTSIRGVRICCHGEIKLHGSDPYVSVDVPKAAWLMQGAISSISKMLGMPIMLWIDTDFEAWVDPPGWTDNMLAFSNQNAAFLMIETNLKNSGWGWVLPPWNIGAGNVVAVRQDGKDLALDDIRLMCFFARRKLQPLFEDAVGCGLVSRTKQEVLKFITRENMMKCKDEAMRDMALCG